MAYPHKRSCVGDLQCGMTDGAYKKYAMNRGGLVETTTAAVRRNMNVVWHGFADTDQMCLPDGSGYERTTKYVDVNPINGAY